MNGLEALNSVRCALSLCPNHDYKKENDLCNIIEKELKALEIIKKYAVNCYDIIYSQDYEHYLFLMKDHHKSWVLKKEEFDLLKEVLK